MSNLAALADIAQQAWDAVVIGAGPAGGLAACLLAKRGFKTLLIERSRWPRHKACGGCVNAQALAILNTHGLDVPILAAGSTVDRILLKTQTRSIEAAIPQGLAVSRDEMDRRLVDMFTSRGGLFLCETTATIEPDITELRRVRLRRADECEIVSASVILVCDGLGGTALPLHAATTWVNASDAWIGVATTDVSGLRVRPNTIEMHVAREGYVGLVGFPTNTVHIAAALSPHLCGKIGPRDAIASILSQCRSEQIALSAEARLIGTGPLTKRRKRLAQRRMLMVGDSCGYVEPFTGQGIAWALATAQAAVSILPEPAAAWPDDLAERWEALHHRVVGQQHRRCHAIRYGLHRPAIARASAFLLDRMPALAKMVIS